MTATTLNSPVRKQAEASIDAVANEIQHAARQELESLRSLMNVHLAALDRVISRDQNDTAFDPIIEKLCEVAGEQAEAASTSARAQAEAVADGQLEAARAQARADLDAAHAMSEAMRAELEQRLAKSDAAGVETARALADLRARTDAALLEAKERLAQSDAAGVETARALADLRARTDAALLEGKERLAQSEAAKGEAVLALAETERVAAAARREADAGAASLAEARGQIATLEGVRADLMLGREIAEAHLEGEVHNRNAIAAELEVAREKALHAKADADRYRLELQRAAARIHALEEQRPQRDGDLSGRSASGAKADLSDATGGEAAAALAQVRSALQRIATAASGRGLLDAALKSLAENFSRVALCMVGPQGCTVWGSRGFDPPLPNRKVVIPATADSPLTRALANGKPATVRAEDGEELLGVAGSPIGYAMALPIVVQDQCIGMLYAENPPESSNGDASVAEKIAEILADHLGMRLRPKGAPSATTPAQYSQPRQASRVKVQEGTSVAVDGADSTLVDLSILGAQVLSPRAIKPNRSVKLLLPSEAGALTCEARVVWVVVERGKDQQKSLFRAGIQFTDVNTPRLEAFFSQHGVLEPAIRH
jgi:hypothetical protein